MRPRSARTAFRAEGRVGGIRNGTQPGDRPHAFGAPVFANCVRYLRSLFSSVFIASKLRTELANAVCVPFRAVRSAEKSERLCSVALKSGKLKSSNPLPQWRGEGGTFG